MDNDDKLNLVMNELNKFPNLRNKKIKFNKVYTIPLWDEDSKIKYEIKGEVDGFIDWEKPLPDKTKFYIHIFTKDNKEPYRIENHAEPCRGGDYVIHRNIRNQDKNKEWIEHEEYSYSPFYSTVSSFLGGFPRENDTIEKEIKKQFNW